MKDMLNVRARYESKRTDEFFVVVVAAKESFVDFVMLNRDATGKAERTRNACPSTLQTMDPIDNIRP